ncbi:MAG TPA: methylglyoxal synthase [Acholeplasmataceae bacterium]|nr:methylglyoxal synthase [Acholeplasmataceae bacterium]
MRIALIAHDKKKEELVNFVKLHESEFSKHALYATGTTGKVIMENTNLEVTRKKSGPHGGDQEIGSMVANGKIDIVFFFRDPLTAQAHEPDISALLRLCDLYQVPLATNINTANYFVNNL